MNFIKKNKNIFLYISIIIFISCFFITLLNYFNIINYNIKSILLYLTTIISLFVGGIYVGKRSHKKAYIDGIKLGSIISLIFIIFSIILKKFNFINLLYYSILIMSSSLGSIIGINKKR